MAAAQSFRDNDVEALADDVGGRVAEQALGTAIPQADHPVAARIDDCVRSGLGDRPIEFGMLAAIVHAQV